MNGGAIVADWTYDSIRLHYKAMKNQQKRPKFLNLFKIHLPITGITSIAHRISGVLLFVATPAFIYYFHLSLKNAQGFLQVQTYMQSVSIKLIITLLLWSLSHHLFAGIRFLLSDLHIGNSLAVARRSAWLVNLAGLILFLYLAYKVWL